MGLDMYLEARRYVQKQTYDQNYNSNPVPEYALISTLAFPADADKFNEFAGLEVNLTVGYWRKANAIHNWFIQNCANGVDDCRDVHVEASDLTNLLTLVSDLLTTRDETKAQELLPPTAGFFFGSTEMDEWYWNDLEYTKEILEHVLTLDDKSTSFYYRASW